jgi:hypothetical protein
MYANPSAPPHMLSCMSPFSPVSSINTQPFITLDGEMNSARSLPGTFTITELELDK